MPKITKNPTNILRAAALLLNLLYAFLIISVVLLKNLINRFFVYKSITISKNTKSQYIFKINLKYF